MNIKINGKETALSGQTIQDLLNFCDIKSTIGIALAINEVVVPKSDWGQTSLKENDSVLIISPTQGG